MPARDTLPPGGRMRPSDILPALALLTRLPLPDHAPRGAEAAWAWPLAGLAVGAIGAAAAWAALAVGAGPGPAAAAALVAQALATGALHEDGLADTADGLLGGRTRERRLEIMKDSRIGSFGALALLLVTLARWSALAALIAGGPYVAALLAAGALSRAPMAVIMALLPNARGSGLSQLTGRPALLTAALAVTLALAAGLALVGWQALAAAAVAALLCAGLALSARARIGGQTGDILGASQQIAEAAVLALIAK